MFTAGRIAICNRLVSEGWSEQTAERWVTAWEAEADRQGLERPSRDYWSGAPYRIAEENWAGRPT
jgi:hypothetical protein